MSDKRKKCMKNRTILSIFILLLLMAGIIGAYLSLPGNDSDAARWFKTNFFPADEYATTSLMDTGMDMSSQEYEGSTPTAWMLCGIVSTVVILCFFVWFARERGYFG